MVTSAISGVSGSLYVGANKVAECSNLKLKINGKEIDVTSVDSAGWDEFIAGRKGWEVSGDFNLITGDTNGFIALQTALINGTKPTITARSALTGYNWSGTVLVTAQDMALANPGDKQQTVSWTLKGSGAITPAAS